MDVCRRKLSSIITGIHSTLAICKVVGYYASLLLLILGFMLWFDFRPLGMICAILLGIFWCFHSATLQLQKSVRLEDAISKIEAKLSALRASNPIRLGVWVTSAMLTIVVTIYFLPWWVTFATVMPLLCFVQWKYEIKIILNHESAATQESQLDIDVEDFLPEINEINLHLLKEVDEQCNDINSGASSLKQNCEVKNAVEQEEDLYLDMLIPEINSNDFESAEQSASSSDEMFCPDNIEGKSSSLTKAKPNSSETKNTGREKHIEFKISHFNANSSSDSDDNISRGLCFSNNDDDTDSDRRRKKFQNTDMTRDQESQGSRYQMMDVSSMAGNVLLDTVYKHILDTTINHNSQTRLQQDFPSSAGSAPQNPIIASISNTIRSMQLPTLRKQKHDDSTDEDVDSDFEILNSEELNNL